MTKTELDINEFINTLVDELKNPDRQDLEAKYGPRYIRKLLLKIKTVEKVEITNKIKELKAPKEFENTSAYSKITNLESRYTISEIKNIFENKSVSEVDLNYTKKELSNMYFTLYGKKPLSGYRKMQIIGEIKSNLRASTRGEAFAAQSRQIWCEV